MFCRVGDSTLMLMLRQKCDLLKSLVTIIHIVGTLDIRLHFHNNQSIDIVLYSCKNSDHSAHSELLLQYSFQNNADLLLVKELADLLD